MNGYGRLALTGGGLTIGGLVIDQAWLVAIAVGLVVVGATLIRFGFRRSRDLGEV